MTVPIHHDSAPDANEYHEKARGIMPMKITKHDGVAHHDDAHEANH